MKEWYLTDNYKPTVTSGYESDAISEFAESNFTDVTETYFADRVLLCNSDLSDRKEIRCIIQGNSADTQLKSMERIGLFPIGTVKAGMYIFFDGCYWIIDGYPSNNKSYEKATMKLCQYKLKWQNSNGDIIERWGNFSSASKYDDGEVAGQTIILSSDNLTIVLPDDSEVLYLGGKRVFIDKRPIPEKVYKLTRSDDVLYDFQGHGGVLSFIADKTELDTTRDNQELGICDYIDSTPTTPPSEPTTPDETEDLSATISGTTNLRIGVTRTYTATLSDKDGNTVQWNDALYGWNVASDFDVKQTVIENKISLTVEDEDFIDSSFILSVIKLDDNSVIAEIEITVIDVM